jgi:hypothetical protein
MSDVTKLRTYPDRCAVGHRGQTECHSGENPTRSVFQRWKKLQHGIKKIYDICIYCHHLQNWIHSWHRQYLGSQILVHMTLSEEMNATWLWSLALFPWRWPCWHSRGKIFWWRLWWTEWRFWQWALNKIHNQLINKQCP